MSDPAEKDIIRRPLETDDGNPASQLAEAIATIEDTDPAELPPLYECVNGMLDNLFSQPPVPEAQMTVEFSYKTYRITVEQDGVATFVRTE